MGHDTTKEYIPDGMTSNAIFLQALTKIGIPTRKKREADKLVNYIHVL